MKGPKKKLIKKAVRNAAMVRKVKYRNKGRLKKMELLSRKKV
jgi:hypothetical protein